MKNRDKNERKYSVTVFDGRFATCCTSKQPAFFVHFAMACIISVVVKNTVLVIDPNSFFITQFFFHNNQ